MFHINAIKAGLHENNIIEIAALLDINVWNINVDITSSLAPLLIEDAVR